MLAGRHLTAPFLTSSVAAPNSPLRRCCRGLCTGESVTGSSAAAVASTIGMRFSAIEKARFALILMRTCCGYRSAAICNPEAARENVVVLLNGYLDEYIDATLRNILNQQEGAEVSLGDYLYIKGRIGWKGLKKSEYLSDSDYRIINGESLTMSGIDWNKAGYISKERYDESPEIMLEVGDILLSKDGTIGKIGYVDELERPTTVASGIFVIRNLRKDVLSTHFVYYLLKSRLFKAFIASRTEGSVIPHLYQKDFVEFLFPLPPIDVMKKFDKLTGPMFQQTIVNAHENKRLAELRDALLPKLMSGEIDVSKIDLTQLNSHLA